MELLDLFEYLFTSGSGLSLLFLLAMVVLSIMIPIGIWLIQSKINNHTYVIVEQTAVLELLHKDKEQENLILMDIADSLRTLRNK